LSDGQKKKYIEMYGSFKEPFNWQSVDHLPHASLSVTCYRSTKGRSRKMWPEMGFLMINALHNYCWVWKWKNFENQSTFAEVMSKNQVGVFCYCATQIARTCYGNMSGWVGGWLSQPVFYQNDKTYLKTFLSIW